MRSFGAVLVLAVACVGCSQLDMGIGTDVPEWDEARALAQQSAAQIRAERLGRALAVARSQSATVPGDYLLGPGDVLEVGIFALEDPETTTVLPRLVGHDGQIALPWVESVRVQGLTARQASEAVRAAYGNGYLKNPQVSVTVTEHRSSVAVVTGSVAEPDVYPLEHNTSTILELLALAGGLTREAGDELLLLRGGGEVVPINLRELIDAGDLTLNLQVRPGDILTVPPLTKQYIYVLGYVQRPGVYELRDGASVDALRAVAFGGGASASARAQNSYVIRPLPDGQETIPVDLRAMARGEAPLFHMRPGDALVVGTSTWARVAEIVRPSMGASVSASASVLP